MKNIYFLTLLGAMLLGNVFVYGQSRKLDSLYFPKPKLEFGRTLPGYIKPPMVMKITGGRIHHVWTNSTGVDSIRIMAPDRMPCLVTDLSRMERMPVQRYRNLEPMPNGGKVKPVMKIFIAKKDPQ
ncbi:MAG TPA: hypothetical protein VHD83_06955 [Puia sp.]|nr:hypothetical protein [Puia sp.]